VLPAKEENVLQGITDRQAEVGGCHGMEMNVDKSMTLRIPKQPFPVENMIDQKQTGECGIFELSG